MMHLKYKYRLYPSQSQEKKLLQVVGACRWIWNHFLEMEQQQYQNDKTFRFYSKNNKDLTELKRQPGTEWLKEIPSTALQYTLRYLDQSLGQSFKKNTKRKGFPIRSDTTDA